MHHHARYIISRILIAGGTTLCASSCQTTEPPGLQTQTQGVTSPSFLEFESGHVRPIAL